MKYSILYENWLVRVNGHKTAAFLELAGSINAKIINNKAISYLSAFI